MGQTLAEDHCQAAGAPLPDGNIVRGGMCGPNLVGASAGYTRCPLWDSNIAGGGREGWKVWQNGEGAGAVHAGVEKGVMHAGGGCRVPHNKSLPGWAVRVLRRPPGLCRVGPGSLTMGCHH